MLSRFLPINIATTTQIRLIISYPAIFTAILNCSGGDADQIEEEFHQLAGSYSSQEVDSPIQSHHPSGLQTRSAMPANNFFDSSIEVGLELQNRTDTMAVIASNVAQNNQPVVLTAEQRAMIEAKRVEALRRRQLRMQTTQQQSSTAAPMNPYAKR